MLGNAIQKNESDKANIVKKLHNFMTKTQKLSYKNWNDIEMLHPDFTEEGKEDTPVRHVDNSTGFFFWNLGQRL